MLPPATSFRMPSSRKWPDLTIRKENQSHGQVKNRNTLIAAISKMNFLWCNSLEQDRKPVLDGWDGSWDVVGCRSWLQLCFSPAQRVLHCKASKPGVLPPLLSFPAKPQLQDWHCRTPGRIISACLSHADGCLSGVGSSASHREGSRGAVVDYRSFRDRQLFIPVAAFTEVRS